MAHEAGRRGSVPVIFAGLEEHAVPRPNLLDRAAAHLYEPDPLGHVDRLAVRMRVPGSARARSEADSGRVHAPDIGRSPDRVDVDGPREPIDRPGGRLDTVPRDLHGPSLFTPVTRELQRKRPDRTREL